MTLRRWITVAAVGGTVALVGATALLPDPTYEALPEPQHVAPAGLLAVHATPKAFVADRYEPPGACHYRPSAEPGFDLPDPACTPGAVSLAVTQDNIQATICRSGYTSTVRPSSSVTGRYEQESVAAYAGTQGITGEFDHLIPLELGGANSQSNMWAEPGGVPNPKDLEEGRLHRLVCAGKMPLAEAQQRIATDWTRAVPR